MGSIIKYILGCVFALLFWAWAIVRGILDLIGWSTSPEDFDILMEEKLPKFQGLLFSGPDWLPALLAVLLTVFLLWLNWPQKAENAGVSKGRDFFAGRENIDVSEIDENFKMIPITGDLSRIGIDTNEDEESAVIEFEYLKHDAPNQEGVDRNWKRICFGFRWENISSKNYSLKIRILALDPDGCRFSDNFAYEGPLTPGQWGDEYPVEMHMRMTNTPRIKYDRDGVMTELEDGEKLIFEVEFYSDEVEIDPCRFAIGTPVEGHERFIVKGAIPLPTGFEFA